MDHRQWRWMLVAAALTGAACHRGGGTAAQQQAPETPLHEVTVQELAGKLAQHEPVAVFDNNSHDAYLERHIPTARWVEFNHVTANDLPANKDTELVFYCHSET